MIRTQVSLTQEQHRRLTTLAATTGRSMSDLVRSAVYGSQRTAEEDLAALRQTFGAWHDTDTDGAAYVERIRSGARRGRRAPY